MIGSSFIENGKEGKKMIKTIIKPLLDDAYKKGVEAGIAQQKFVQQEDQNRRLYDMLKYGKKIGKHDGIVEGWLYGYEEGKKDAQAQNGVIEISGEEFNAIEDDMKEV